jgi:hypothetical protein
MRQPVPPGSPEMSVAPGAPEKAGAAARPLAPALPGPCRRRHVPARLPGRPVPWPSWLNWTCGGRPWSLCRTRRLGSRLAEQRHWRSRHPKAERRCRPTKPNHRPTKRTCRPTKPNHRPTKPNHRPTKPNHRPTKPNHRPTKPNRRSTKPSFQLGQPGCWPGRRLAGRPAWSRCGGRAGTARDCVPRLPYCQGLPRPVPARRRPGPELSRRIGQRGPAWHRYLILYRIARFRASGQSPVVLPGARAESGPCRAARELFVRAGQRCSSRCISFRCGARVCQA